MSVLDRVRGLFAPTPALPLEQVKSAQQIAGQVFGDPSAKEDAYGILASILPFGQPPKRGTREMMLLYSASPWMRSVLGDISDGVGQTQWKVYAIKTAESRKLPAGQRSIKRRAVQLADAETRRKMLQGHAQAGELEELEDHPLLDLLNGGNRTMDGAAVMALSQLYDDLKGDVFLLIERDEQGLPVALWPVPTYWVIETPSVARPFFRMQFGSWTRNIPEPDIIWKRDADPFNPFARGIGRGESLSDELETDEYASKYLKAWFYNNALPAAIVSMEGGDKTEAERLKQEWRQQYQGFFKSFQLHFTSRKIDVKQLSQTFADQQLTELRQRQRDIILETFGYPKELLGILDNANRSTIDTAAFRREKYVIEPRREKWRRLLQTRLVPEFDDRIVIDYVSTVPEDREFTLKVMTARPSAFSENEVRALANHAPLPDAEGDARPPLGGPAPAPGGFQLAGRSRHKASGDQSLSEADFENVIRALQVEALSEPVAAMYGPELRAFVERALASEGISVSFEVLNPLFLAHVKQVAGDRLQLVNDSTRQAVRDAIARGVGEGEGIDDISDRILGVPGLDANSDRAEMIARTEVTRSSNWGQQEAWKASGVVDKRMWIATADGRTRDTHKALNGQQQPLGQPFTVGGKSADYPGGFGDPAEDINCRCTMGAVIEDPELDDGKRLEAQHKDGSDLATRWKRYAAHVEPWEVALTRALAKGFRAQRAAVEAELEKLRR